VSLPVPHPGLIIRYSYLWHSEFLRGQDEGVKERPCVIVLTVRTTSDGIETVVLPITHRAPVRPELAVELPVATKRRLGLDDDRSWIVIDEANRFIWPGPDLRPARRGDLSSIAIGVLPPGLFEIVKTRFLAVASIQRGKLTQRTE
jgi:hypothetical protein